MTSSADLLAHLERQLAVIDHQLQLETNPSLALIAQATECFLTNISGSPGRGISLSDYHRLHVTYFDLNDQVKALRQRQENQSLTKTPKRQIKEEQLSLAI